MPFLRMTSLLRAAAPFLLCCLGWSAGYAQTTYPDKPIKFILGFGPGSATDAQARLTAQGMSAALGQPIIVENRPGALSTLATEAVARSKPDGYTVLVAANSGLTIGPAGLIRGVRYDAVSDFEPVGHMVQAPYVLMVDPKLPVKTLSELVELMRKDPERRSCSFGNASTRVFCELLKRKVGLDITIVPFKSTPESSLAVMGGQVTMQFLDLPSAIPRIRSGQLRALATMEAARNPVIADVPTASEAGLSGIPLNVGWVAMLVPAKTPPAIVARLNAELNAVLTKPDVRKNLEETGYHVRSGTPAELGSYLKRDLELWKKLIPELGLQPEG
ncbi:Bug family tripartite tricarboxylate transporter substrate binding protein [Ottowia thiooxydans]|uniref:Bug family tripartite tricarboxylate transporter substrate binding protein n=1 Tax=Ottowia thiooxydans TaxID=219182 RepID=UPI000418F945|nr:tripartite tricarboxylate transporter substrate-binding protein [Ottowia thiooxydans]